MADHFADETGPRWDLARGAQVRFFRAGVIYTYNENRTAAETYAEFGTFGGGSFNLPTVTRQDSATGSYHFTSAGTESFSGTATDSQTTSGSVANANPFGYQSFASTDSSTTNSGDQYSFSGNDYYTNSNQGTNTFASLETGSFAGNSYGLSNASYQWSGSSTLASQETSVQSSSGTGSSTQYAGSTGSGNSMDDGTTSPGSGSSLFTSTDSYAFGGTDTSTASRSGSGNFSLTAQGSYAAGSWALSSITSAGSGTDVGTVTDNSLQTSSGTGTTTSNQAGTNSATTAYGGINGNSSGSYSNSSLETQVYGESDTSVSTISSSDTYSGFQAGSFAHGSYGLNSVLLQDSSLAHSTESDTSVQTATGGGLSTSTSSGNGLDTTVFGGASFNSTGTTSTSGTESYVFTSSGTLTSNSSATDSSTSTQAGCFTGARFAFTSVIMQDSGNDSYSDASNALETRNGAGNSLLTSISGDASADATDGTDFTSNGNDGDFYTSFESYTFASVNTTTGTDSGTDCYSNYQAAQELGGSYALSSVLLQATGTFGSNQTVLTSESPTLGSGSATDSATYGSTQTTTLPMYDTNSTGSTSAQSNDTYSYIMSSTETATSASAGSYTNYQAGSFAAGSFAFGSVLFKDGGNDTTTDLYTSLATYNGGGTSSSTFQGHGAETSTFANNTVGANGTTTTRSNESYAFTNIVRSTDSSTSADTYSDYQAGTNANDSYAFNSMVNQDQGVSLDSYTEIGVQSQNGNAYSVETFNGLDDDTENGGGTNVLNNYLVSSSTYLTTSAYTLTQHSTDTSQSFLAGTYAADTDSLSCAALSDNGVDTYSSQALGTTSSTALSILTSTGSQSLNGDGTSALPGGTYSFNANNSYTSLVSSTNYDNESGIDTYSSFGLGNFAAGSYAFQSMGSSDNSTSTSSTGGTDSQTDTGVGTYASTGTTTAQAPVGYAGTATLQIPVSAGQNDYFQFTNYSNDSYSNTATDSSSSFGLGVQSYGEVNLSCLVATDNGTTISNMTATANESYSGNGNTTQANIGTTYGTYSSTSLYTLSSTSSSTQSETSTGTTSDYQAGTSTAGEAAFNSVLFLNGDTDASTYTEDGTWSTSGGDSIAYAFGTYNFHQSGAFAGTDTHHLLTTSNESDTGYQAGCFTGDSYAFASVLFLSQGSGTKTAHENAMNSYSGVANSSSVLTTTTGGGSVGTVQVNSAYGAQTYSSYFTQTDDTAGTNSSTLYQAGSFANDSYAFTSYVSTDRGTSGDTYSVYQTQSVQSYISTLTEINGSSSLATDAWNNVQQAGSITSFTSFDTFQTNGYSTASYNDYQAGAFSNGSASFSSVVQQQATSDSYSAVESYGMFQGTDLFAGGSAVYTTTYVGTSSGSSDQAVYTLTTVSATERGFDSASTLQAGSFAAGSYAFATVLFTSSGSYTQTFDSEVLTTWPNYSADVYSTTDPAGSNGSSVDSWLGTGSNENFATQSSSFNLYEAGNYAAGSYAFTSMVHTANANSNTSYAAIYTQTTFSSEVDPSNNEVTTSWITSTANGGAMSSSSLYEAGLYDPVNGWSLSSLVESQGTIADDDDVYSSDSTFANFLDGYTTTDDGITTTTDEGTFALYAAGSYAGGSYNFSSFAMQQTWLSPINNIDTQTDTRSGMVVGTGSIVYCYTLQERGTGQTGLYTLTSEDVHNIEWDTYDLDGHLTNVQTYASDVTATHSSTFDLSRGQPIFPAYTEGASWPITPQTAPGWTAPQVAAGGIQIANVQLAAQATWTIGTTPASRAAAAGMLASMPPPPATGPTSKVEGDEVADEVDDSPIVGELFDGQDGSSADDDTTANEDQWTYSWYAYRVSTLLYDGSGENGQLEQVPYDVASPRAQVVPASYWNDFKAGVTELGNRAGNILMGGINPALASGPSLGQFAGAVVSGLGGSNSNSDASGSTIGAGLSQIAGAVVSGPGAIDPNSDVLGHAQRIGQSAVQYLGNKALGLINQVGDELQGAWQDLKDYGPGLGPLVTIARHNDTWGQVKAFGQDLYDLPQNLRNIKQGFEQDPDRMTGMVIGEVIWDVAEYLIFKKVQEKFFGNCFPADAMVGTEGGLKPIARIEAGERVWAYDLVAGNWRLCKVLQTFRQAYAGNSAFVTAAGETIESTLLHPYWVVRGEALADRPRRPHLPATPEASTTLGRWVDAGDVQVGDEVLLRGWGIVPVTAVWSSPYHGEVYNFQVAELECYTVGQIGVLVHNSTGGENKPVTSKSAADRGLAKATEHRATPRSFNDARALARELSGVGEDAVPFRTDLGPHKGSTVGRMSPDGSKGWRIDFDPNDPQKGFHVNWWDRSGGKKRANWIYGYVPVKGGTEAQFLDLLQHAFGNLHGR